MIEAGFDGSPDVYIRAVSAQPGDGPGVGAAPLWDVHDRAVMSLARATVNHRAGNHAG
jgi:hypothetical protein